MRRSTIPALILLVVCLVSLRAFAQQNRIVRVGVVTMQNRSNWPSAPVDVERDYLVTALEQEKPDKKLHVKVQVVPIEGTTSSDVEAEARQKNCDYVVYTTLVGIKRFTESRQQDTRQTDPGGVMGPINVQKIRGLNSGYQATVEYKLYRTGDPNAASGSSVSNSETPPPSEAVGRAMDEIANRVFLAVKKTTPQRQP
jgi:hypothetical protein